MKLIFEGNLLIMMTFFMFFSSCKISNEVTEALTSSLEIV